MKDRQLILITGTPGTGKTTIAQKLAKDLDYEHIELSRLIKIHGWHEGYDRSAHSFIVDEAKLRKQLSLFLRGNAPGNQQDHRRIIIDTHLTAILGPSKPVLVIITGCRLKTLFRRLKARRYPQKKIRENLDAEIFEVCRTDAEKRYGPEKVIDYDSAGPLKTAYPSLLRAIKKYMKHLK
ncbi:MAG: AAA family ATPase [DPANN group archaeon]|nr:AAA family ATPase [DPANN group archaeon]